MKPSPKTRLYGNTLVNGYNRKEPIDRACSVVLIPYFVSSNTLIRLKEKTGQVDILLVRFSFIDAYFQLLMHQKKSPKNIYIVLVMHLK